MSGDLERVLRGFEKAQEFARTYRFEMTDRYRALIERVEAMPRNLVQKPLPNCSCSLSR